jgi:drug/metabolite transporter (DMT)-like permease
MVVFSSSIILAEIFIMLFLALSILCSTSINLLFKAAPRFKAETLHVIVINYFFATLLGVLLAGSSLFNFFSNIQAWMLLAIVIGILFIIMFRLMATSVQKAGINPTTIAGRLSVIIPVAFSLIYYHESISSIKLWGFAIAIVAVLLSVYKKTEQKSQRHLIFLPLIIFFGAGLIDSLVKFAQESFVTNELLPSFTALLFFMSLCIGILMLIQNKEPAKSVLTKNNLVLGFFLGSCNFGSIFFFIKALAKSNMDSSIVFGINHIGIVALSVFFALILFKERVLKINWLGILLAVFAIVLLFLSN